MGGLEIEEFFAPFAQARVAHVFSGYDMPMQDACFAPKIGAAIGIELDDRAERAALAAAGSPPMVHDKQRDAKQRAHDRRPCR